MDTSKKSKSAKNVDFVSNFHFRKCLQNTCKNRFEINAFCRRFEILCGVKFEEKGQNIVFFVINFYFGKSMQDTGKNCHEMNAFCMRFETLCGKNFE